MQVEMGLKVVCFSLKLFYYLSVCSKPLVWINLYEIKFDLIDWFKGHNYVFSFQMEWSFLSPTDTEPTVFQDQGSLSSHRQHGDGTYSQSSHLTVPSSVSPGTKITCTVSHLALDAPISVSLVVESPQPGIIYVSVWKIWSYNQ